MRTLTAFTLLILLALGGLAFQQAQTSPQSYDQLRTQAEKFFGDQSFSLARELYLKAVTSDATPAEKRWTRFRLADTLWRAQAASQTSDSTPFDQAREELERLVREAQPSELHDRIWAEAQQSLGDFWWTRRNSVNWGQAWPHYQQALEWWAASSDIDLARHRYLQMVWTMSQPGHAEPYYYYGYYGNVLPLEVLENGLKIAQNSTDKARLHYLIAMTLRHTGDWEQRQRVPEEFEAAIQTGKTSSWHDDALYHYGEWMANQGLVIPLADGQWRQEADYVKALQLFRRLVLEYAKGETRYFDQAQEQIKTLTNPAVQVAVPSVFLPDSEIQYHVSWRNIGRIDFTLTRVDLTRDVRFAEKDTNSGAWLQAITPQAAARVKSWAKTTNDKGDHKPGQETLRYDGKLPSGAYLLEARNGTVSSRELILVGDSSVVLKASAKQALVYFCNAVTSAPIAQAQVKLWEGTYNGQKWVWRELAKQTGQDGIAVFDLNRSSSNVQLFAAAAAGERQAFSLGQPYEYSSAVQPWRVYAFTDRPAYRPKEQVQWKFVARRLNGAVYTTPAQQTIEFEITDPRSAKVKEGKAVLNGFGSSWGSLELSESMPLGEYTANFWDAGRRNHIGSATLFRLEEYKLPEFKVSIRTAEENGRKKAFQLGDKVEVNIQADFYFGGAVANANAEVIVYQNPFYHHWQPPQEYPWYYADMSPSQHYWGGAGTVVKRETLKTDATGKAVLTFETPRHSQQDYEYRIEARITDASRREVAGSDTVRVTRQPYYVYPRPKHNLHRPQDKVVIDIKALDANDHPVQAEGRVKVMRDYWYEIWLNPEGREVQGEELKSLRDQGRLFPPPVQAGTKPWQLKFRGYQHDDVLERPVKTTSEGEAEFAFTPEREGYYRILWTSETRRDALPRVRQSIRAETTVWVARNSTTELGYRHGGLEIIVDKDTFQAGKTAPVLLSVPSADRYVLFAAEADDLYNYQLVHVTGTVKLVELDVQEKHVPNIFLSAAMVSDQQIFQDTKQVVVPPLNNFLRVEVKPDRSQYEPRQEGTLVITATDHAGKPVAAELGLGLVDESVYYIQPEYAGDPRQFYYGAKRPHAMQMQSTLNLKRYSRLVDNGRGVLVDDRDLAQDKEANRASDLAGGRYRRNDEFGMQDGVAEGEAGGVGGGVFTRAMGGVVAGAPMSATEREEKSLSSNRAYAQNGKEIDQLARKAQMANPAQEPAVQVRSDFRSTAFWQPDVVTGADGKAVVKVKYPDSVTTWKAVARAASAGNQFGLGSETTRTQQPLIVRLQAPRFFVVGDRATVSAIMNNNTDQPMTVTPSLSAEGLEVQQTKLPSSAAQGQAEAEASAGVAESSLSLLAREVVKKFGRARPLPSREAASSSFRKARREPRPPTTTIAQSFHSFRGTSGRRESFRIKSLLAMGGRVPADSARIVQIQPHAEARVDWIVSVQKPGNARLKVTARGGKFADAMEKDFIVYEHGIEKFISKAGKLRGDDVTIRLELPRQRKAESTMLNVQITPSLAVTMLDALPYLIDYPYGCTEQTMSRFLPAAITMKTLKGLGVAPETVMNRLFGGIETQHASQTHPKGKRDLSQLDEMVRLGLDRLYSFQHSDGGWGWWKDGESDHFMSAYVVWGLTLAREAGIELRTNVLDRGVSYLDKELVEQEQQPDLQAWMLHALAAHHAVAKGRTVGKFQAAAFDNLWVNRAKLNAYTRALVALSAHQFGMNQQARTLVQNLENGVKRDNRPDSSILLTGTQPDASAIGNAHWGEDGIYWRWSDGGVEATAFALRALLAVDPKNPLIEPVTNWIIRNRRGAQWSNTRDTAMTVLALNDYLRQSGELAADAAYEVRVNGQTVANKTVNASDVLSAPSQFEIDRKLIRDGANEIRILRKGGKGPLYFVTQARFFSLEEPVSPAGNEIFVRRQYYRLASRPTLLKGFVTEKLAFKEGDNLISGDRVEVVLTVEAKNNYEYLVFEDLKPAGLEAVEIRSGGSLFARELKSSAVTHLKNSAKPPAEERVIDKAATSRGTSSLIAHAFPLSVRHDGGDEASSRFTGRTRWVYQELRDRKVALFIDKLPEGLWEIRYELRAEVPGEFHALPVLGHAMYVPEIRCNGEEQRVCVLDR